MSLKMCERVQVFSSINRDGTFSISTCGRGNPSLVEHIQQKQVWAMNEIIVSQGKNIKNPGPLQKDGYIQMRM